MISPRVLQDELNPDHLIASSALILYQLGCDAHSQMLAWISHVLGPWKGCEKMLCLMSDSQ